MGLHFTEAEDVEPSDCLRRVILYKASLDVQAGFRRGRGTRDQIANIYWIIEKEREFQKNLYFCFIDYAKDFDLLITQSVENSERDGNTRPPDLPLEESVCRSGSNRTGHGTTDLF